MYNEIIQSLWIGNRLSNNEILCIKSFVHHRHEFHIYIYEEIENIPIHPKIKVKDANEIIPSSLIFKDLSNTYASFSDWFRVKLLFQKGGWWVDMDTVCLKPFRIAEDYCFSTELRYDMHVQEVNNTYIKSPPGSSYLQILLEIIDKRLKVNQSINWGEIGIHLFRDTLNENIEMTKFIKDPIVFCPVNYVNISELICDSSFVASDETLAIHLWNEIWRRGHLDKNAVYHPNSVYERLKGDYLK